MLMISNAFAFVPPCSELTDLPTSIDDLVPLGLKEGKSEIHVYRKYFISKRGNGNQDANPFSETVWTLDLDNNMNDLMFRMRVQSPNTNFKIALTTTSGSILADAASIVGYGASISSIISKDKLDSGDSKAHIKFHFYDFLKTPEEIIVHEDVHDCHLPHIVLEMSIMKKETFKARKEGYLKAMPSSAPITFPEINDYDIGYSNGAEKSSKKTSANNLYSLSKTESTSQGKFQILKEYHISISSEEERKKTKDTPELLYYLQLQLVSDFMTSGSMHVVVVHEKDDNDPLVSKEVLFAYDSLNCAEEMVCVVSQRTAKNEESLNIALTEGNYGIYFVDYQNEQMRNFIADTVQRIPFSSTVFFYPVESQENSIYCDGLAVPDPYFIPYTITDKTIFDQRIEVNLRNVTQDLYFDISVQDPTYFRVTTEQDIGMDVDIRVYDKSNNELGHAKDIGATETVVVKIPKSGRYKVQLSYRNSIVRDLMSCPQLHLYVSSLSESKAKELGKKQKSLLDNNQNSFEKIESVLRKMQNAIENGESYTNDDDFDYTYVFSRESFTSIEENIYENKITNNRDRAYWIYIEIFSDQVFNDIVVNMDFDDRRFTRTTSIDQKLSSGQTDQLLRSQKALHRFSMFMSYKDTYILKFLSRNMLGNVSGFDDQLKHVMFQMKVEITPVVKNTMPMMMTALLPPTFNNLRDLGLPNMKYNEITFFRERILLSTQNTNKVTFELVTDSRLRVYLKSLVTGISVKDIYVTDSSGSKVSNTVIQKSFTELDVSFTFKGKGSYTLNIETSAKKRKFGEFFLKAEIESKMNRKQ